MAADSRRHSANSPEAANDGGCRLGYVQLGQSAVTLSGGELSDKSQKIVEAADRKTLYLLDEPTTDYTSTM